MLASRYFFRPWWSASLHSSCMAVQLRSWALRGARHLAHWCQRYRPCSPSRWLGNGRTEQIGSVSCSSPLVCIWQAADHCRHGNSKRPTEAEGIRPYLMIRRGNQYRSSSARSAPDRDVGNEYAFGFNRRFYPFNSFRSLLGISGRALGPTYELGVEPRLCLALEDSHIGVRSAAAAGMMTVMVPDLLEPTEDICTLCVFVARDLHQVRDLVLASAARRDVQ